MVQNHSKSDLHSSQNNASAAGYLKAKPVAEHSFVILEATVGN
jgi:hypothetical protein